MKNKNIGIVLVLIIIIGVAYFVSNHKKTDDEIRIGISIPLTGKASYIGEQSKNVSIMAEEDMRKAYPNSNIRVIIEDNTSENKGAVAAAKKLVEVDKVDALHVSITGPALASFPVAQEKSVVYSYSAYTDVPLTAYKNALKTFVDYRDLCATQGTAFSGKGYTKVVTMGANNGLAEICKDSMSKTFKGDIRIVNLGAETDVRSEVLKLKHDGYQAIISSAFEAVMIQVIKASNESSYNAEILCNLATCITANVKKQFTSEQLKNVVAFGNGVKKSFEERYVERFGPIPSAGLSSSIFEYEMIVDLSKAFVECGKNNPTCVVEKTQGSKAENGGITNYVWKDRSMIPEVLYWTLVDGNLVQK